MILNGIEITVIGMIIVFGFLAILVLTIKCIQAVPAKFSGRTRHKIPATIEEGEKHNTAIVAAAVATIKAHITASGEVKK